MKRLFRDLVVFLISLSGASFVYRMIHSKRSPLVRVVAFHNVADPVWFEATIRYLKQEYNIISPRDFHEGRYENGRIHVLVTFDDGYESWQSACMPILRRYGVSGLFFISSGLIDVEAEGGGAVDAYMKSNLKLTPKVPLSWEGVRALSAAGHTIGGHTVHHKSLLSLSDRDAEAEIVNDKAALERELGHRIEDFAYPFGTDRDYSDDTKHIAECAGYSCIYTAEPGFQGSKGEHIPRTLLEEGQSIAELRRWMGGSYDLFSKLKRKLT